VSQEPEDIFVSEVFLIKKELMFFTKGGLCSLPRGVGRSYLQLKKAIYNLKK